MRFWVNEGIKKKKDKNKSEGGFRHSPAGKISGVRFWLFFLHLLTLRNVLRLKGGVRLFP
jgi:hypothetical protein